MVDARRELKVLGKRFNFGGVLFRALELLYVLFVALGCFSSELPFDDEGERVGKLGLASADFADETRAINADVVDRLEGYVVEAFLDEADQVNL